MSSSLQSGSSISHYRVISPLGAGGMGEVYLAQDETLERAVALKVLPRELTRNEERVRRFIQEAKSASSLSHPHIVTIYEIGQAEVRQGDAPDSTPDGAPIHFIAMELVSGQTLREKIHHEKTDLRTLIRFLAQAAEGLAKAHSAGIIHRDLKPENIMVTKDGYAKVLDFGLAKLTERREGAGDATSAPTATREQTREGAVVGTVAYMSPEQVQAKPVDHRSDIFSFGCILYEAASRSKPFSGDSDVEVMHKILRDKPTPIEDLHPEVPAELRRLIRRCLAKAPDQRLQSMKDLSLELIEIADEYEQLSASATSRGSGSAAATSGLGGPASGRWSRRLGLAAAVIAGLGGIAFGLYSWRGGTGRESSIPAPFQSMRMARFTSTGKVERAAISPDGKYLANVVKDAGTYSLWVKQVATGSDVQIVPPLPTPFLGVSFSPDGNYVYYVNQETGGEGYSILYQVPVLGGASRKLIFDIDTTVSFAPDGKRLAFVRQYPQEREAALMVANADGTGERKLAVRKDPEWMPAVVPSWSPDGKRIAVFVRSTEGGIHASILNVDVSDGKQAPLAGRWWIVNSLAWVPDGSGLILTGFGERAHPPKQVWFVPFPTGEVRRITNDLNDYSDASVTADGKTVAATQVNRVANLWVCPSGDSNRARQITFGSSNEEAIRDVNAASDVIIFTAGKGGRPQIWSLDFDGRRRSELTPDSAVSFGASVSRDGGTIAFQSLREDGLFHAWKMDRDGGNAVQLTHGKGEEVHDISPDGSWLTYDSLGEPGVWRMPVAGGTPTKLAESTLGGAGTEISPDGKWITNSTYLEQGGRSWRGVVVLPAEGGKPRKSFLWPDGFQLRWAPAGDALTYGREVDGVGNLWSQPLDGGPPRQITSFTGLQIFSYDWSPDGKQLVLSRGQETRDVVLITDFR